MGAFDDHGPDLVGNVVPYLVLIRAVKLGNSASEHFLQELGEWF